MSLLLATYSQYCLAKQDCPDTPAPTRRATGARHVSAAAAKAKTDLCVIDFHPAEHDCQRIRVDFTVHLQLRDSAYATQAVEMCGAGITLNGNAPVIVGDEVELRIDFPGRRTLEANGLVRNKNNGAIHCEFWAANSYEQQFLDSFVTACAKRQELRKNGCAHTEQMQ
jgi:hypothetical protein